MDYSIYSTGEDFMQAYHNNPDLKAEICARMQAHMDADELVRGVGFDKGHGCAVGCTLNNYDHEAFETEIGFPGWVAHLNDKLHENTSDYVWPTLQLRFLQAVPVGFADWGRVERGIKTFILKRNIDRVRSLEINQEIKSQVIAATQRVLDLLEKQSVIGEEWSAARSARSAASAASEAELAARLAARSAARSARSAARSAEYDAIAEKFIELVSE